MTKGLVSTPGVVVFCLLFAFEGPSASAQRLLGASGPRTAKSAKRPSRADAPSRAAAHDRLPLSPSMSEAVAWQAALDRAGFSPGVIDGVIGRKTKAAIRAFQAFVDLPLTGRPDRVTSAALGIGAAPAVVRHAFTADELRRIAPPPADWNAKSRVRRLGYRSREDLAAEIGHCTVALLRHLNPRIDVSRLRANDALTLPNVEPTGNIRRAASVEIDLTSKIIRARAADGAVIGLFHCSIARDRAKRPRQSCRVKNIVPEPEYLFDPQYWPEIKTVDRKLTIPPGPRSPVGLCWIGLTIQGYGIHGTPDPELIGKTGSHGCFRLTNWDALRLAGMLKVGTEVRFANGAATARASRRDTSAGVR